MPIPVMCSVCNAGYTLRDEYAGRRVKCPQCQNLIDVPTEIPQVDVDEATGGPTAADYGEDVPEVFHRDKFLLRQKLWAIKEKYTVADEDGEPIIYVERPVYLTAGCLALLAGLPFIIGGIIGAITLIEEAKPGDNTDVMLGFAVGVVGVLLGLIIIIALYPKRHVKFYSDESKEELILEIKQEKKWAWINFWYTLVDGHGDQIARFRKNFIHGILRKRWYIHSPEGEILFEVKEDSIILSLLRRTIGGIAEEIPLLGLALAAALRTNFIFTRSGDMKVIAEFNRRLTLLDRYVLDLSDDEDRSLDRRVAVAMGVLLDTGERR